MKLEHAHMHRTPDGRSDILRYAATTIRGLKLEIPGVDMAHLAAEELFTKLSRVGYGGLVFYHGGTIAGYIFRKESRTKSGLEWTIVAVDMTAKFREDHRLFEKSLGYFGKILFESAWVKDVRNIRFIPPFSEVGTALYDRASKNKLRLGIKVRFDPSGDMSRLILEKQ